MKQLFVHHRKTILAQALVSGGLLALVIYVVFRTLFYEFPMSWAEEASFFLKTTLVSCLVIGSITGSIAWACELSKKIIRKK